MAVDCRRCMYFISAFCGLGVPQARRADCQDGIEGSPEPYRGKIYQNQDDFLGHKLLDLYKDQGFGGRGFEQLPKKAQEHIRRLFFKGGLDKWGSEIRFYLYLGLLEYEIKRTKDEAGTRVTHTVYLDKSKSTTEKGDFFQSKEHFEKQVRAMLELPDRYNIKTTQQGPVIKVVLSAADKKRTFMKDKLERKQKPKSKRTPDYQVGVPITKEYRWEDTVAYRSISNSPHVIVNSGVRDRVALDTAINRPDIVRTTASDGTPVYEVNGHRFRTVEEATAAMNPSRRWRDSTNTIDPPRVTNILNPEITARFDAAIDTAMNRTHRAPASTPRYVYVHSDRTVFRDHGEALAYQRRHGQFLVEVLEEEGRDPAYGTPRRIVRNTRVDGSHTYWVHGGCFETLEAALEYRTRVGNSLTPVDTRDQGESRILRPQAHVPVPVVYTGTAAVPITSAEDMLHHMTDEQINALTPESFATIEQQTELRRRRDFLSNPIFSGMWADASDEDVLNMSAEDLNGLAELLLEDEAS